MKEISEEQKEQIRKVIEDVRERFTREMDQGLLKRDLYEAIESMAGRQACDRIWAELLSRFAMAQNAAEQLELMSRPRKKLLRAVPDPEKVKREA